MSTQSVATVRVRDVCHHDALGDPGRPRREEDVGGIVGPDRMAPAAHLGPGLRRRPIEEVVPADRSLRCIPAGDDDRLEGGQLDLASLQHGDVVGAQEVGDGDEDPDPAPSRACLPPRDP